MKILLKGVNARLLNGVYEKVDIEIDKGQYSQIGSVSSTNHHKIIEIENLHCAVGFFDPFVNFCEPGLEYKEDFKSGVKAAAFGGFTQVALVPDTEPIIDNRPQLDFVKSSTKDLPVDVEVSPSFTKAQNHNELSEIAELAEAGAMAFSQQSEKVVKSSVLLKALEYSKITHKKIIAQTTDFDLVTGAFIHEGNSNVKIGMRGIPDFAEELMVKKYIELLRYTGSSLHISGISSSRSLPLIKSAKSEGLNLSVDTSVYNLLFSEEDLLDFDTNFKLNPPLRSLGDRDALINAVKSGIIDVVTCRHSPQDEDLKKTEMKMAAFGVLGLQTMFSALCKALGVDLAIEVLTTRNRKAFNLLVPEIKIGAIANLSLFDPNANWQFDAKNNLSKSENSMFLNQELKGKPIGIVNGQSLVLNE